MKAFNPDKELRKIQHGNRNKVIIFVIALLVVSVISYSFALYQVRYSKRIIYTKVAPFSNHDLDLAVYVNGKPDELPAKNIGYKYSGLTCDNGTPIAEWDEEKWELKFLSTIPIPNKCNLYFVPDEDYDGENFEYSGKVQEYIVPKDGLYKLEVWGAQGGGVQEIIGGYGGYSTGIANLKKDDIIYIVVGGKGASGVTTNATYVGGYNGGGISTSNFNTVWGAGGGATHIATESGLLSELENKLESILIVAGGGGGAGAYTERSTGGHAGGYIGGNGSGTCPGYGGTQATGGRGCARSGSFGKGADRNFNQDGIYGAGGGGGYYGGGDSFHYGASAGGGSSYISPNLKNAAMYCYSCTTSDEASTLTYSVTNVSADPVANSAKTGAGYAKITYLGQQN